MYFTLKNKPIGVFDSGLGGLTAVKELMKILPRGELKRIKLEFIDKYLGNESGDK